MADAKFKLAIVGASARAAAQSALRAGFRVVAADLFADADLQTACRATRVADYPQGLSDWLAAQSCDAWMYTGALENYPALVDRMAGVRPLLGCSGRTIQDARSPHVLRSALHEKAVRFPEIRDSPHGLPLDGSWLAKTYGGSSGSGVWTLDGAAALDRAIREHAVCQALLIGQPAAAIFVAAPEGCMLLGVTRQLVGPPWAARCWQYAGSIGPARLDPAAIARITQLGDVLAEQFELRGLIGVDLVVDGEHVWLVEINPRFTASCEIVERFTGISTVGAHVAACLPGAPQNPFSQRRIGLPSTADREFGKAIVFAPRHVVVTERLHAWAMDHAGQTGSWPRVADVPHRGESIPVGRPVLTVFAEAPIGQCGEALRQRVAEVDAMLESADR